MGDKPPPFRRIIRLSLLLFGIMLALFGAYEQRNIGTALGFLSLVDRFLAVWGESQR